MPRVAPTKRADNTDEPLIALLRGINVGGKHKVPMKELSALFTKAGCDRVQTYIQSGNVIFRASVRDELPQRIASAIERRFGFEVPVVVRTSKQVREALRNDPFEREGVSENERHIALLASVPSDVAIAALDPARSPGDRFVVAGDTVYLHLPNGVARTKLTNAYFDSKLQTVSTLRNLRTMKTLVEMCEAVESSG